MIIFDTSALSGFKSHSNRGIGRFVKNLVFTLQSTGAKIQYLDFSKCRPVDCLIDFLPRGKDLLRNNICYLVNSVRLPKNSVVIIPSQTDCPLFFARNFIVIVHDLIPLKYPELYGAKKKILRYRFSRFLERSGILRAKSILAISNHVKEDLVRLYKIDPDKIQVFHQGIDDVFLSYQIPNQAEARTRLGLPLDKKLLLYYGGTDARKNLKLLFELALIFEDTFFILIVGFNEADRRRYLSEHRNLILRQPCLDAELLEYISACDALFFPSLEEGFGLPVFEVSAVGKPVIASRIKPYVDFFQSEFWYFDPNFESARSAIQTFLQANSNEISLRVSQAQEIARRFTWKRSIEEFRTCLANLGYET